MTDNDFAGNISPMPEPDHLVWDELAAGAALHALEPDEQQLFDLHLADCDRCLATLGDAELVAAQLGTLSSGSDDDFSMPEWSSFGPKVLGKTAAPDELAIARQRRDLRRLTASRRALTAAAAVVLLAGGAVAIVRATTGGSSGTTSAGLCQGIVGACHSVELQTSNGRNFADIAVTDDTALVKPIHAPKAAAGETYVLWQVSDSNKPTEVGRISTTGQTTSTLPVPYKSTLVFAVSEEKADSIPSRPSRVLASSPAS